MRCDADFSEVDNPYGQRAPSEIIPSAARIAKANPKPA
jgi:hypothetical protein